MTEIDERQMPQGDGELFEGPHVFPPRHRPEQGPRFSVRIYKTPTYTGVFKCIFRTLKSARLLLKRGTLRRASGCWQTKAFAWVDSRHNHSGLILHPFRHCAPEP